MIERPQFTRYTRTRPLHEALAPDQRARTGIYVLRIDDGTEYVGQAMDVTARYRAHEERWGRSILSVDFAPVRQSLLSVYEFLTILERQAAGVELNNELLARLPYGVPRLDEEGVERVRLAVLTQSGEEDLLPFRIPKPRRVSPSPGAAKLLEAEDAEEVLDVLAFYVHKVLRCPADTEELFWRINASMRRTPEGEIRMASLVVRSQKVVDIRRDAEGVYAEIAMAARPELDPSYAAETVPGTSFPSGLPMRSTCLWLHDALLALHEDSAFLSAARGAARELFLSAPHANGSRHDPALADAVYAHINKLTEETA